MNRLENIEEMKKHIQQLKNNGEDEAIFNYVKNNIPRHTMHSYMLECNKNNMNNPAIRLSSYRLTYQLITTYKDKCNNIEFRSNIASDLPEYMYGDSINLKKILISLLDNAIKYTNNGYVELNVSCVKKKDLFEIIDRLTNDK